MASQFFMAPGQNFIQTTLNGAITDSAATITLNSTTNLKAPGYVVIDRVDSDGNSTAGNREFVSYTGVSGNDLTGCSRGADGSTARTHSDGAIVETVPTIGMWNSLTTIVASAVDGSGYLKAIPSAVSISTLHAGYVKTSSALLSIATVLTHLNIAGASITMGFLGHLNVSGASTTGLGLYPVFIGNGKYSGPTTNIGGFLRSPKAFTLSWVSWMTRNVVSTASMAVDLKLRGASCFADATVALQIPNGGTYVSTASLATKNVKAGDILQADLIWAGADAFVDQITIQAG